jgi:type II secretory pathway pseudopilin PulG
LRRSRQAGFTYIALLLVVAIMGVWLAATANVWQLRQQREKEKELLFVGHEFRQAIERYARAAQGTGRKLPLRLEDLLLDERVLEKRRHLRRIYADPMTGNTDWGLVRQADGQIIGVHSLSTEVPLKKAGFGVKDSGFSAASTYADWVFLAAVQTARPQQPATSLPLPSSP